ARRDRPEDRQRPEGLRPRPEGGVQAPHHLGGQRHQVLGRRPQEGRRRGGGEGLREEGREGAVTPAYSFGETLLDIEDVSLEYHGRQVLKNVNAHIKDIVVPGKSQGQVVGFLGPSGIGKTQLFRIIAGLNKPTSGEVRLHGSDHPVRPGEVGVVAQNYPLFEHKTVYSNLMLAARKGGLKGPADEETVS